MTLNDRTNGNSEITLPVRVLHLIEHLNVGGTERLFVDLVKTLDRKMIRSTVCLYREKGLFSQELESAGYPVVFLRKDILTGHLTGYLKIFRPFLLLIESLIFVIRLSRLILSQKIHIVHSHMFSANLWGRLSALIAGKPGIIITEHTKREYKKLSKEYIMNRILSPLCDRAVAVNSEIAETIETQQKIKRDRILIIPNGIKVEDFEEISPEEEVLPAQRPRIAAIGRLVKVKRHDILLRALKICLEKIPDLSCLIIGDGPERPHIERMAQELNISKQVFFLGERADVMKLLPHLDLLVNTSDREGLPMSLLEAMATGLPVVATEVGGNKEVVQNGKTGLLVRPGDFKSVAEGILQLIGNPEMTKKMGQMGRERIKEHYSIGKISKTWEKLYQEVYIETQKS